ncbi:MAG: phage tail assembly chaperone [Pseudomonadota bacterium]
MSDTDNATAAFPWETAMAFGFGVLRLSPEAFWSMTPKELAAAMNTGGPGGVGSTGYSTAAVTSRSWLEEAASRFPDHQTSSSETQDTHDRRPMT